MQLTILPEDNNVIKDSLSYLNLNLSGCGIPADVHALQWNEAAGWIEYNSAEIQNEPITVLPDWANNCLAVWQVAYDEAHQPPPPPTALDNKATAILLLQNTDWATIPDVSDPTKSNPYLANANDFVTYRNAVRQYAINPVAGDIAWPTAPTEVWTTV